METESKYLKKIRDEIEKKSGKTETHEGPNTVPNYLNGIAKAVKNLDIGGGGGGVVEGPFSFTNETTDTSGTYNATVKAEVTDKKILYSDLEVDKNTGDAKKVFSAQFNAPSPTNRSSKVTLTSYSVNDSNVTTLYSAEHISTSTKFSYTKGPTNKTMTIAAGDITTDPTWTWAGGNQSLKETLEMIPAYMKIVGSTSVTIEAGDSAYFNFPINSNLLKFVNDIHSWSILCGYKSDGSNTVDQYRTLPVKNDFVKFTQSDSFGVAHSMEFDLENNTDSDMTFDEVVVTLLYRRKSSYY